LSVGGDIPEEPHALKTYLFERSEKQRALKRQNISRKINHIEQDKMNCISIYAISSPKGRFKSAKQRKTTDFL